MAHASRPRTRCDRARRSGASRAQPTVAIPASTSTRSSTALAGRRDDPAGRSAGAAVSRGPSRARCRAWRAGAAPRVPRARLADHARGTRADGRRERPGSRAVPARGWRRANGRPRPSPEPARGARAALLASTMREGGRPHSPCGDRGHLPWHRRVRALRCPSAVGDGAPARGRGSCSSIAVRAPSGSCCDRHSASPSSTRSSSRTSTPTTCWVCPGLLKTYELQGREHPLELIGPTGLADLIRGVLAVHRSPQVPARAARGTGRGRRRARRLSAGGAQRAPPRAVDRMGPGRGRPARRVRRVARRRARRPARTRARRTPARERGDVGRRPRDQSRPARRAGTTGTLCRADR